MCKVSNHNRTTIPHTQRNDATNQGIKLFEKLITALQKKNARNIPRHKLGFYSFIGVAASFVVILSIIL